jgi:16S rRNA (uracil1498-N3)-methyltransferase
VRHPALRLPAAAAHVFVDDVAAPALRDDDAHHLARVLRLRDGEAVTVSDGRGAWRLCAYNGGALEPQADPQKAESPSPPVAIAFALAKGDKPELIVQKLTELGVDRIVPIAAARSVVRWDDAKAARNVARLDAVARAAAMQSRRAFLPAVEQVATLDEFLAGTPSAALAHPGEGAVAEDLQAIAVGPEGGWTDEEAALTARHVDLGPTTLRAETAALAAGVLLTALRDGRVNAERTR